MKKTLFWNVDTQEDFIDQGGKLYVPGAELIRPVLRKLTSIASDHAIRVVNTCDYHFINSEELSAYPDFQTKFPQHCMAGTPGAEFIAETNPESPVIIDWNADLGITTEIENDFGRFRNLIIRKDAFDVFAGNKYTDEILAMLDPDQVIVYGVTTNVCVDKAVVGIANRGYKVYVVRDAIKELPSLPLPFDHWESLGVTMIVSGEVPGIL